MLYSCLKSGSCAPLCKSFLTTRIPSAFPTSNGSFKTFAADKASAGSLASSITLYASNLHTLDEFPNGKLYIMAGGSCRYIQKRMFEVDIVNHQVDWESERSYQKRELRWTIGAGPGFEIGYGSKFRLALEMPLTYNWKNDIIMYIPQVGIYYYFR